uniref:EGF-like domain-containing protein n=1 Tax=Parascaris equorum TaxID=6256 RepID=A0A914R0H0_PAREQ
MCAAYQRNHTSDPMIIHTAGMRLHNYINEVGPQIWPVVPENVCIATLNIIVQDVANDRSVIEPYANCTPELCHNGGTCVPVQNGTEQVCYCPEGFQGTRCQYECSLMYEILERIEFVFLVYPFIRNFTATTSSVDVISTESLVPRCGHHFWAKSEAPTLYKGGCSVHSKI